MNRIHKHSEIWIILARENVLTGIKMLPSFFSCCNIVGQHKYLITVYFVFFMNADHTGFSVSLFCGSFFLETLFSARLNSVVVSAALMSFCKSWAFFSRSFFLFSIFLSSWIRYSSSATYRTKALGATSMCKNTLFSYSHKNTFLIVTTLVNIYNIKVEPAQACDWRAFPIVLYGAFHGRHQRCRS